MISTALGNNILVIASYLVPVKISLYILTLGHRLTPFFLDFSKAFDKVPHECLFLKLSHYGIQGAVLSWIKDFLTNQSQQVVLNNTTSEFVKVLSGVPLGSVL